ncbi:hypothetical protein B0H19DRAFT_1104711 [Mycena capillaripes]|nr:hypothetical protein B0H19DRAFT_1104711 [Mycena capillaripes]
MSLPIFTATTTAEDVASAFAEQIKGKNVLVTGTSINGIGFETARVLAKHANLVIITGYNSERLKLTEEAIKKEISSANIRPLVLDLSSLAAVRKAAAEVNAYTEPLHIIIHNAAASIGKFKLTVDNLETQMATDHVGPFLLTKLVAPKLLAVRTATYTPRVVFVSSTAHAFGSGVSLNTVAHSDPEKYTSFDAHFQTKSANILFAIDLHPGAISTNINQKEESKDDLIAFGILKPDGQPNTDKFPWKTIPEGAATSVTQFSKPVYKPGSYLDDSVEANDKIAPHSSDPETAAKLWKITEEITGESFTF